jgi:hypothetical protein
MSSTGADALRAPTALETLVAAYLASCRPRGLAPSAVSQGCGDSLKDVFLPRCAAAGHRPVEALDQRTLDRFTSELLDGPSSGESSSPGRRSIATYAPVRQLLAWCQREGEGVRAKPQLPRRHHGKGRRSAEGPLRPRQSSPSRPAHVRQLVDARR